MKQLLYVQFACLAALLLASGCSTSRTASYSTPGTAYASGYTGQGGTGENLMTVVIGNPNARTQISSTTTTEGIPYSGQGGTTATVGERVESDHADIALSREELVVGKREVSNGGVVVRKVIRTENVSQPIDLRREEYVIERIPASEAQGQNFGTAFQGQEIFIPLMREEAVVGKQVLLTENVRIGKRIETDHQTITRPIRSEDIEVVRAAATAAPGTATTTAEMAQNAAPATTADSLTLACERLNVGKRNISNGGVTLRKVVRTQDASQGLDLRREEFTIDRTSLNNQLANAADFREQEIRVDLMREEPVVSTRNFVTEVVHLRKKVETDTQNIAGTVRCENVEVVQNGTAIRGSAMNRETMGQGGTARFSQAGGATLSETGTVTRPATQTTVTTTQTTTETTVNTNGRTTKPIPPPKAGEVLEYHDFNVPPTEHP